MIGSLTGFSNQYIHIQMGGPIHGAFGNATPGMMAASGVIQGGSDEGKMYAETRTQASAYWRDQNRQLDVRQGKVEVGSLQQVDSP